MKSFYLFGINMKKLILILPLLLYLNVFAAAPRIEVQPLIDEFEKVDLTCRGGRNITDESPVCKRRDKLEDELYNKGWCHEGLTADSPSYTFIWQECRTPPKKK